MESEKKHTLFERLLDVVRVLKRDANFVSTVISFTAKEAYACTIPARVHMIAVHTIAAYVHSAMLLLDLNECEPLTDAEFSELHEVLRRVRSTAYEMLTSIPPSTVTRIWAEAQQQADEACQQRARDTDIVGDVYQMLVTSTRGSKEIN